MFIYKNNKLILKQGDYEIPLPEIAKNQTNPFYLYDLHGLREWYRFVCQAIGDRLRIFFAMKANSNKHVLKTFQKEGSGVDVVSIWEARQAQEAGFPPERIVFSGVGKSALELEEALDKGFFQINVESSGELKRLSAICQAKNKICSIGLRINPNVDFPAHPYIKTGLSGHKFGLEEEELPSILKFIREQNRIQLKGLSMHLGSQIFDPSPLFQAIGHLKKLYEKIKADQYPLEIMDIGGGLAVNYQRLDLEEEKARVQKFGQGVQKLGQGFEGTVIMEPGRLLTARFGLLCTQVEYVKKSPKKQFVILNSGMNHLLRPALYKARHEILPFKKTDKPSQVYDVGGPICETGDLFAENCKLPELQPGDWLALASTGAYGFVMANQYNSRPLPQEICYDRGRLVEY